MLRVSPQDLFERLLASTARDPLSSGLSSVGGGEERGVRGREWVV